VPHLNKSLARFCKKIFSIRGFLTGIVTINLLEFLFDAFNKVKCDYFSFSFNNLYNPVEIYYICID